jgi:hypothetical protein
MSWNNLVEKSDMSVLRGGPSNKGFKSEADVRDLMESAVQRFRSTKASDAFTVEDYQYFVMAKITKFIKYNKNLLK